MQLAIMMSLVIQEERGEYVARVVILGAGLTGLSTAYHLEQQGISDYKVFEKNNDAGGLLRSFSQDGFTFDFTGHLLHISSDYFRQFLNTITSLDNFLHINRKSAIHTHNTLLPYPFQMNLYGLPKEVIYECVEGFIKRTTSRKKPTTFPEWVEKYFGKGIGKHFFYPYNSKILAYDIKKVHPAWTGRFVPKTSLRSIIEGAVAPAEDREVGYNSYFYYPKKGGIQVIINGLQKHIKGTIETGYEAERVDPIKKIVYFTNGKYEKYDTLVSTLPLDVLLKKSSWQARSSLKSAAHKLLCNTVLNFNLGFNTADISNKHWLYFPEKKYLFYRVGFWNNICPSSTPQGMSAIYGETSFLPGSKSKQQQQNHYQKAIEQALDFLKLSHSNIVTEKHLVLPHAYVIYDAWREKNLKKLHKQLNNHHILSTGRFGEWKYSSMQEAVLDGKQAAEYAIKNTNTIVPAVSTTQITGEHKQQQSA